MLSSAERHYAQQQQITVLVEREIGRLWAGVTPAGIDTAWARIYATVLRTIIAGQLASAQLAGPYVAAALAEQGIAAPAVGQLASSAFAGAASDGRALETLVGEPVIQAKAAIVGGATRVQALDSAQQSLIRIAATQVADAGRAAVLAEIVARPAVQGYVRMLRAPSCARCAVLAGRWYRYNAGFARHPHCDCIGVPAQENRAGDLTTDPQAAFAAGQVRGLSQADARAVRDGADLSQVVNAHRTGMAPAGFTAEGTTHRGLAGQRLGKGVARITPDRIYATTESRDEAIAALRANGYIL